MVNTPLKRPELLAPAGSLDRMQAAYDYGADAVYAGLPRYSLRARNNGFSRLDRLKAGIERAHQQNKKFYVAVNVLPHNSKLSTFLEDMQQVIQMQPDAFIMADPGLIMQVRKNWPQMPIHLSVQANTTNYWGVQFWQEIGIRRIILSRELSLKEIAEIRNKCPDMELEVFVHGALCIAYSGRCLLSGYFNHRDPNQGTCTNACRWNYTIKKTVPTDTGDIEATYPNRRPPQADSPYLLEEKNRPGSELPIMEDEHGTYIMNSKDLRAVEYIQKLIDIGVDSLKIEGRTKSIYYVARATQVYRRAIEDAVLHKPFDSRLLSDLEHLANRGYTSGFLDRHPIQDYQNYLSGHSVAHRSLYVGQILDINAEGWARVDVKNKFSVGDTVEILSPKGNELRVIEEIRYRGEAIDSAPGNGIEVLIPHMQGKEKGFIIRILQEKAKAEIRA